METIARVGSGEGGGGRLKVGSCLCRVDVVICNDKMLYIRDRKGERVM